MQQPERNGNVAESEKYTEESDSLSGINFR